MSCGPRLASINLDHATNYTARYWSCLTLTVGTPLSCAIMTNKVPLTFACGPYAHTQAVANGTITPAGISLNYLTIDHPRDIFDRQASSQEFSACEFSASEYICRYAAGARDLIAIPVFPSRTFRHSFIAINKNKVREIHPKDLEGKRVGVQLYTMTAAVWIRGVLAQHGVDLSTITWVQGAMEKPGSHGKPSAKPLLKPVKIENNESDKSISDLLAAGDIDATIGADPPPCLGKAENVSRLFPNFREEEKRYYKETGIFPIMHVVVIKKSVLEQWPFVATSLYNAIDEAKDHAMKQMRFLGGLRYMLPWLPEHIDEIDKVFGKEDGRGDPWVYGLEENRQTLEALVSFLHQQGMIDRMIPLEELFVKVNGQNWKI